MNLRNFKSLLVLLVLILATQAIRGQDEGSLPKDLKASLIDVAPGYTAYTAHGHCALRMQCPSQHLDYCFTYGLDNNSQSYISFFSGTGMGKFATTYTKDYLADYVRQNREVREYELNLSLDEKRSLWALLDSGISDLSAQQYDYLKTNCSSMCIHAIENVMNGESIAYDSIPAALQGTYRDFVRHISLHKPWTGFFWNSLLGAEGEAHGALEDKLSPQLLVEAWRQASIVDSTGARRPVFANDGTILVKGDNGTRETLVTPTLVFATLLLLVTLLTLIEKKRHWVVIPAIVDGCLLFVQTLLGLFICYMTFLSSLPGTSGNWYAVVFNPLPIALWLCCRKKAAYGKILIAFATVLLLLILLTPFVAQLDLAHALVEATLCERCLANALKSYQHQILPNYTTL